MEISQQVRFQKDNRFTVTWLPYQKEYNNITIPGLESGWEAIETYAIRIIDGEKVKNYQKNLAPNNILK